MKISIIGAGVIGSNLARLLSSAGHNVGVADARGREITSSEMFASGARAIDLANVTEDSDVIILAVPFSVQTELARVLATAPSETLIVDTSNYYSFISGPVGAVDNGQVESLWVQEQLGRPIVKAWNAALAGTQQRRGLPPGSPNRIAIPVAADSAEARATIMKLVDDTGFDPFDAGPIAGSWRQQPGTPAYCTELGFDDLGTALAIADKNKAPITRDRLIAHFSTLQTPPSLDETVAINRAAHT